MGDVVDVFSRKKAKGVSDDDRKSFLNELDSIKTEQERIESELAVLRASTDDRSQKFEQWWPRYYSNDDLEKVGVQSMLTFCVAMKCKKCKKIWATHIDIAGKFTGPPPDYWKCPNGCNS